MTPEELAAIEERAEKDALFAAHARTDVPLLTASLRVSWQRLNELRIELERANARIDSLEGDEIPVLTAALHETRRELDNARLSYKNLQARIFGDGGHRKATEEETDQEVVKLQSSLERANARVDQLLEEKEHKDIMRTLIAERDAAYEQAARVCDDYSRDTSEAFIHHEAFDAAIHCAGGIRALKSKP
jgi:hypothetical protein